MRRRVRVVAGALPVDEGYGLVVGRLRPSPPVDIDEFLGPGVSDELAMLDFADWQPHGETHVHQVARTERSRSTRAVRTTTSITCTRGFLDALAAADARHEDV